MTMKLECDVIRDLLPLYAEKLASPASSALVEQHLAECPACRAELEQMGIGCEPIRLDSYTQKKMTFFFDPDGLPLELHE